MTTTLSVIAENPFLYYEIQKTNSFTPELYEQLRASIDDITEAVLSEDRQRFVAIMEQARKYFAETEDRSSPLK
jgi:prephenate dehydrogenase